MLTDAQLALVGQILTFLGAIGALITSMRNRKAIQEVHLSLNSRLSQLIESVQIAAHAAGRAEGVEAGQSTIALGEKPQIDPILSMEPISPPIKPEIK